jgi:hypothetical protein
MTDHPRPGSCPARSRRVDHHPGNRLAARVLARVLARWLLFGAVIAGVFCLHALTVDHGDHGDLPAAVSADRLVAQAGSLTAGVDTAGTVGTDAPAASRSITVNPVAPADGGGDGFLAGCLLFLVAGSVALLLLTLSRRRADRSVGGAGGGAVSRRGPPRAAVPRLALCVIRV